MEFLYARGYTIRYGRRHKCQDVIECTGNNLPKEIVVKNFTAAATPDGCKSKDFVTTY